MSLKSIHPHRRASGERLRGELLWVYLYEGSERATIKALLSALPCTQSPRLRSLAPTDRDRGLAASLDAYWAAFATALKLPNLSDLIQCLLYL
jgi:hypothetical protein